MDGCMVSVASTQTNTVLGRTYVLDDLWAPGCNGKRLQRISMPHSHHHHHHHTHKQHYSRALALVHDSVACSEHVWIRVGAPTTVLNGELGQRIILFAFFFFFLVALVWLWVVHWFVNGSTPDARSILNTSP